MTYDYQCKECLEIWEMTLPSDKRDEPLKDPCIKCGGKIRRLISLPNMNYETSRTSAINMAGSGWNDKLKQIKQSSGKGNTINVK